MLLFNFVSRTILLITFKLGNIACFYKTSFCREVDSLNRSDSQDFDQIKSPISNSEKQLPLFPQHLLYQLMPQLKELSMLFVYMVRDPYELQYFSVINGHVFIGTITYSHPLTVALPHSSLLHLFFPENMFPEK